ncbi:MAG: hypothetical protein L3J62_08090 [Gammaproteobacteria bacterium]|nr:hypothetical protein [Gammaproteobacteria bacterium]MCF6230733.1 hypothetical protein [Gammaproteobacteria bacterium]
MSYKLKGVVVWLMHLLTWPLSISSWLIYKLFGSEEMFSFSAKLLSLVPGKIGQYLRTSFYCVTLTECKYDLVVGFASFFAHPTASAGRGVVIGSFSIIGSADLGNNILVSSRVSIMGGKYQHDMENEGNTTSQVNYKMIKIGNETWLGEGSLVMADIEGDSTVSAGSVVTKPMPAKTIAIGNPARFLKKEATVVSKK